MKKIIILLAVAGLGVTSCKKDRSCSCKTVTNMSNLPSIAGSPTTNTTVEDETLTLQKTSYLTAFRACTHTKDHFTDDNGIVYDVDTNCSLK